METIYRIKRLDLAFPNESKDMNASKFSRLVAGALLLLLSCGVSVRAQDSSGWQLKRDKGGVKVYVRELPGSRIKELRFTSTIEASLHSIAYLLTNVEGFDNWVYASVKSETIRKISDQEIIYYTEMDFPWPFSNRDLVLYSKFWQDPHTLALHSRTSSVHWLLPEKEGLVRIKMADLRWTFTPIGNGKVRVEYYMKTDPGGNIPAWLVNLAADQGPLQTISLIRQELKKEKYQNTKMAFVSER